MKTCKGCGIEIQKENQENPGYVPEKVYQEATQCQRCYRLTHYRDLAPSLLDESDYEEAVIKAVEKSDTVFLVLDIIDFESSLNPAFEKILRRKNVVAVITKIDLLPSITSKQEALEWVKKRLVYADKFITVSGKRGFGIDELQGLRGKVTAIVGTTNAGKSTLVKRLIEGAEPTISPAYGTTLGNLTFSDEKGVIIDTPGLWPKGRLLEILCSSCAASLVPDKKIISKLFELRQGQGISLGGVFYFSLKSEKPVIAITFTPESVLISKVGNEKIDAYLARYNEEKKTLPCEGCIGNLEMTKRDIRIGNEDLVIPGLGWISFRHTPATLEVIAPEKLNLPRRSPLVGPKNKNLDNTRSRR